MMKHDIINECAKEEYCEYIYDELILNAKQTIIQCQSYMSIFRIKLPISCYTNFRDALFHFYKMHLCVTEFDVYTQSFAVKEHLSRAETDAINNMIVFFSKGIEVLLKESTAEIEKQLRHYLHCLKKLQLNRRMNGMMIFDKNKSLLNANTESALKKIDEFLAFIEDNDLVERWCLIISEKC